MPPLRQWLIKNIRTAVVILLFLFVPHFAGAVSINTMLKIANCESRLQQFNTDGSVKRGIENDKDIGIFQINETYWLTSSKKLGFNIFTLEGNIEMAFWIADHYGTQPWDWSKGCWSK